VESQKIGRQPEMSYATVYFTNCGTLKAWTKILCIYHSCQS